MPGLAGAEDGPEGDWAAGRHGPHGPGSRVETAQLEGPVSSRGEPAVDPEEVVEGEAREGGWRGGEGPGGARQAGQAGRGDAPDCSVAGETSAPAALGLGEVLQGGREGRVGGPVQGVSPAAEV